MKPLTIEQKLEACKDELGEWQATFPNQSAQSVVRLIADAVNERKACHQCWDNFTAIVCRAIPEMRNAPLFSQAETIVKRLDELQLEVARQAGDIREFKVRYHAISEQIQAMKSLLD